MKTVLIATTDQNEARQAAFRCRELGLAAEVTFDGVAALTSFLFSGPDLLCVDASLRTAGGQCVVETIVSQRLRSSTPIIVLFSGEPHELPNDGRLRIVDNVASVSDAIEPLVAELAGQLLEPSFS